MEKLIYSKIASIMKATNAISKGQKNEQQGFLYRGIDDIMNELHKIFAENEVFIIPEIVNFDVQEKISEKTYQGQTRKSITYYTRATIKHHFCTTDGSELCTTTVGEAMDNGDKGMNKAMSIALKYALLQMLLIPTKEDKDEDAHTPPPTRPQTLKELCDALNPDTQLDLINMLSEIIAATNNNALSEIFLRYGELAKQNNKLFSMRKQEIANGTKTK